VLTRQFDLLFSSFFLKPLSVTAVCCSLNSLGDSEPARGRAFQLSAKAKKPRQWRKGQEGDAGAVLISLLISLGSDQRRSKRWTDAGVKSEDKQLTFQVVLILPGVLRTIARSAL